MKKKFQDIELGEVFKFEGYSYFYVKTSKVSFYALENKKEYGLKNLNEPSYEYEIVGKMQLVRPDGEIVKKPKYIKDLAPFDIFSFEHSTKKWVHIDKKHCLPYGKCDTIWDYTYEDYTCPVTIVGKMERKDGSN